MLITTPKTPLVSIIMNCYNGEKYLREALNSVLEQTHKNWELIFWDNQSVDGSANILKEYRDDRIRYFLAERHKNLGESRKNAMSYAKGTYISFLDCDDIYNNTMLEKQIESMENHDYAMCYAGVIGIDQNGDRLYRHGIKPRQKSGYLFSALLKRYEVNMQTVMLRTSILNERSYQFDTNLVYCPDYLLFMTIASKHEVGVHSQSLAKRRVHPESLSNQTRHLVAKEGRYTLNQLKDNNPALYKNNEKLFKYANANLIYYDVISALIENNWIILRELLRNSMYSNTKLVLLKFMLFIKLPRKVILYAVNRN